MFKSHTNWLLSRQHVKTNPNFRLFFSVEKKNSIKMCLNFEDVNVLAWLYFHWSLIESLYEIQYIVEILNIIRGIDKNIMGVYYSPSPQLQGKTIQKNCLEWADLLGNRVEILWQYWICTPWCCYFKSVCN